MNLTNRLDVHLEADELALLEDGQAIQIPTGNRVIVLVPPTETDGEAQGESESETEPVDSIGDADAVDAMDIDS